MDINFWKNKKEKQIDPELFSSKAEQVAKKIFEEQQNSKGKANKPTQIRKFYDEVIRFESILQGISEEKQKDEFDRMLPYLKMLNAKAAYAMGRDLVSKSFKDFIANSLNPFGLENLVFEINCFWLSAGCVFHVTLPGST